MRTFLISSLLCCAATAVAAQQPRPTAPNSRIRRPAAPPTGPAVGNVIRVDAARKTILVTGRSRTDRPQTVLVESRAAIVREARGGVGDLKEGDTIEVAGVPLVIDARQIDYGALSSQPTPRTRPATPDRPERPSRVPAVEPQLTGRVVKLNPLTIELRGGVTAELKVSPATRFTKIVPIALNEIRPGDPIMALGKRDAQSVLVARRVQIGQPVPRKPGGRPASKKPRVPRK
ncbi:MAG: hypothetical protein K0Q72_4661 [Armatimonadetes bacterium]|nr:hypothetical protein [Armatimonadota bacterium]